MAKLECKILNIIKFKKISWLILALSFWLPQLWAVDRTEPAEKSSTQPETLAAPSYWTRMSNIAIAAKERLFGAPITTDNPPAPTPKQPVPAAAPARLTIPPAELAPAPKQSRTVTISSIIPISPSLLSPSLLSPSLLSPSLPISDDASTTNISPRPSAPTPTLGAFTSSAIDSSLIRPTPEKNSFASYDAPISHKSIHDIIQDAKPNLLEEFLAKIRQNTPSGRLTKIRLNNILQQRDDLENTPLHTAILMASPELVTIIQRETRALGIDLRNCKNVNKYTPADFLSDAHRTYTETERDIYLPRIDPVTQKSTTITRYWSTTYSNYVHAGKISSETYDQLRQELYPEFLKSQTLDLLADDTNCAQESSRTTATGIKAKKSAIAKEKFLEFKLDPKIIKLKATIAMASIKNILEKGLEQQRRAHEIFFQNQKCFTLERSLESKLQAIRLIKAQREAAELEQKLTKIPKLLDRIAAFGYYPKKTISSPTRATSESFKPIISSEKDTRLANEYDRLEKLRTIY